MPLPLPSKGSNCNFAFVTFGFSGRAPKLSCPTSSSRSLLRVAHMILENEVLWPLPLILKARTPIKRAKMLQITLAR